MGLMDQASWAFPSFSIRRKSIIFNKPAQLEYNDVRSIMHLLSEKNVERK